MVAARRGSAAGATSGCGREGVRGHADVDGNPNSLKSDSFVKSYVELHAAGALVRCGDHNGLGREVLTSYLDDWRGIFVRYAGHVLREREMDGGELR